MSEIKEGDIVEFEFEGKIREGKVYRVNEWNDVSIVIGEEEQIDSDDPWFFTVKQKDCKLIFRDENYDPWDHVYKGLDLMSSALGYDVPEGSARKFFEELERKKK